MHILVVDDDVQLAKQVSSALTAAGHDPIFVHDGEGALDKAKETPFDLVVLDIILARPEKLDGYAGNCFGNRRPLHHEVVHEPAPEAATRACQVYGDIVFADAERLLNGARPPRG